MSEEERLIAHFEKSRLEFEQQSKVLIPVRMKIALQGFECDVDRFEIGDELVLRRAELAERQAFWSRTGNPKDVELKATENEYFAEFDFSIPRGAIQSLAPGNGINLISIFFSIMTPHIISINRGNFYLVVDGEYRSAGFYTTPYEYRFSSKVRFSNEDLESLKVVWPHFKSQFENNFSFTLVARRYFYSQLRLSLGDRIIDLMISFEALLVPERSGSKGDRIATRLAQMIYPEYDHVDVEKLTRDAYRMRNKIIHGGPAHLIDSFNLDLMSKYCRVAIQKYLIQYKGLSSKKLVKALSTV